MAALTRDRMTPERAHQMAEFPIKAGALIFRGAMTAINATGEALRPTDTGATVVVGVATNSSAEFGVQAGMPAGALPQGIVQAPVTATVRVRRGAMFAFANSTGGDLIGAADWGATVYAVDDQTVSKTNGGGTRLAAGICRGVDADGVWVQFP